MGTGCALGAFGLGLFIIAHQRPRPSQSMAPWRFPTPSSWPLPPTMRMTNKKVWHGTEACWRHSHNDVGDCGDDSFFSSSLPCSCSCSFSGHTEILLTTKAQARAQTGALLKFELSDMLFIVESVKMCALNPHCVCALPLSARGLSSVSVCLCVWLVLCGARNYNAKLERRTRGPQRQRQRYTGNIALPMFIRSDI